MTRNDTILSGIDRGMRIIEIGPSHSPIAPKADGWNACVVDHASTDDLIAKFRTTPGVDLSRIEHVDVVWNGGPLDHAIPSDELGTFDACIMSHVLEHITDPIGFFQSLQRVLKPNGLLSLAYPDKRVCFDFFKPLTLTGELLDAHDRHTTRHSKKTLFDFLAYNVYADGDHAWARRPVQEFTFYDSLAAAKSSYDAYAGDADPMYADCHAWHFTPSSFELVMLELAALGEIDFSIERSQPTVGAEFYVSMRRGRSVPPTDAALNHRRLELLRRMLVEVRDQADCVLDAMPTTPGAVTMPNDWPYDTNRVRTMLARFLTGEGIDVGPGPHPFPVPFPGASIRYVDRWVPDENIDLYPELAGVTFPEPDVICDLNVDLLSAFGDGKLDFVVASHVLEHVSDPLAMLDDIDRVLRGEGIALILLPDRRKTFDEGRPPTPLDMLVRKHAQRVTIAENDDIDEFLRYADPDAFASLRAATPEEQEKVYEWHRLRSIHVHCWHEQEFVDVLSYAIRELGHTWEFLDGVIAEDEGPGGFEFGYVLRKSTLALDADTLAKRFESVWGEWFSDRRRLHDFVAAHASVAADDAALRGELDAFRKRRVVRATDRAAVLLRQAKAKLPGKPVGTT